MISMKNQGRGTPKVQYKLTIADNPAVQNMPHEADYSDNNYESIDETTV